ncbi:short-chain dehydrogenase [Pseudoroseomonas rhizosphaerae]|uniref:Short-chain dehydrogenase n=1 Tax=Teichococcus rhizosphaerae TaxID=1335062 RepID=A0A2C7A7G0_9PROT|nr:SDR family oxidoreductase [Pseudoroseomonas rhizosphaerae]PHK96048.1 short-chain dehydrogenase [Pseudoroseomonas rhizosphaerae]
MADTPNPFSLAGQTVLITGAGGGIGSATARLCAGQGARLVLADLMAPEEIAARIGPAARDAACHRLDISQRPAVEALVAEAGPVDALIDMAAICPFDDWMAEGWDDSLRRVMEVNIHGPINLTRALLPGMAARGRGRIVLCGSVAGWMGGVASGPHYAFSKGGLHAFTRWLARRGAPQGVLVNAIAPGPVETPMTAGQGYRPEQFPLGRMATAEEIAAAAVFLAGPGAGYVSGAVLDVNGAMHYR